MSIQEIPLTPLTLYGIQGQAMMPLASFKIIDTTMREAEIERLLSTLADQDKVIMGNTLIFTESYDAFRVL